MNPVPTIPSDCAWRVCPFSQYAASGVFGKAEEIAVWVDRMSLGVREIRGLDDVDAFGSMRADDVEDGLAVDDRQLESHRSTRVSSSTWDRRPYRDTVSRGPRRG